MEIAQRKSDSHFAPLTQQASMPVPIPLPFGRRTSVSNDAFVVAASLPAGTTAGFGAFSSSPTTSPLSSPLLTRRRSSISDMLSTSMPIGGALPASAWINNQAPTVPNSTPTSSFSASATPHDSSLALFKAVYSTQISALKTFDAAPSNETTVPASRPPLGIQEVSAPATSPPTSASTTRGDSMARKLMTGRMMDF